MRCPAEKLRMARACPRRMLCSTRTYSWHLHCRFEIITIMISRGSKLITQALSKLISDDTAASMTEYALLLALIAVAAIGALQVLGGNIGSVYTTVSDELATVTGS
jgi:Flp pilus assembly pilin Flp